MNLFELAGLTGFICCILAVFFAATRKFKLHKIFAGIALTAICIHVGIHFFR
ncbi:MAG: hypothetical protein VB017_01945 [Endomicrobiaceae bacterium]|nr:hypothetical protein [Endomicrobiaceae bacterium]